MPPEIADTGTNPDPTLIEQPSSVTPSTENVEVKPPENSDQPKDGDQDPNQPKQPSKGVQTRIDELTKARRAAEREAEYWRRVAEGQNPAEQPAKAAANEKPNKENFESYDEYIEALTSWKAREIITNSEREKSERHVEETRKSTWAERINVTRAAIPDFDEVLGASEVPIHKHVADELADSEHGPELAYHFAKNPEVLEKLNGLPPKEATRAIAKLEAKLFDKTDSAAPPPPPSKPLSKAPTPINPVRSGAAVIPTPDKMSMDEYVEMRKKQGASWAR